MDAGQDLSNTLTFKEFVKIVAPEVSPEAVERAIQEDIPDPSVNVS